MIIFYQIDSNWKQKEKLLWVNLLICTNTLPKVNESLTCDDSFDVSIQPFVSSADVSPSLLFGLWWNSIHRTHSADGTHWVSSLQFVVASTLNVEKTLDYDVLVDSVTFIDFHLNCTEKDRPFVQYTIWCFFPNIIQKCVPIFKYFLTKLSRAACSFEHTASHSKFFSFNGRIWKRICCIINRTKWPN